MRDEIQVLKVLQIILFAQEVNKAQLLINSIVMLCLKINQKTSKKRTKSVQKPTETSCVYVTVLNGSRTSPFLVKEFFIFWWCWLPDLPVSVLGTRGERQKFLKVVTQLHYRHKEHSLQIYFIFAKVVWKQSDRFRIEFFSSAAHLCGFMHDQFPLFQRGRWVSPHAAFPAWPSWCSRAALVLCVCVAAPATVDHDKHQQLHAYLFQIS